MAARAQVVVVGIERVGDLAVRSRLLQQAAVAQDIATGEMRLGAIGPALDQRLGRVVAGGELPLVGAQNRDPRGSRRQVGIELHRAPGGGLRALVGRLAAVRVGPVVAVPQRKLRPGGRIARIERHRLLQHRDRRLVGLLVPADREAPEIGVVGFLIRGPGTPREGPRADAEQWQEPAPDAAGDPLPQRDEIGARNLEALAPQHPVLLDVDRLEGEMEAISFLEELTRHQVGGAQLEAGGAQVRRHLVVGPGGEGPDGQSGGATEGGRDLVGNGQPKVVDRFCGPQVAKRKDCDRRLGGAASGDPLRPAGLPAEPEPRRQEQRRRRAEPGPQPPAGTRRARPGGIDGRRDRPGCRRIPPQALEVGLEIPRRLVAQRSVLLERLVEDALELGG